MLNLIAATVITSALAGGAVTQPCQPQLDRLRHWASVHERYLAERESPSKGVPLVVYVVPQSWGEGDMIAWAYPKHQPGHVYMSEEFLCVASEHAMKLTFVHELLHLAHAHEGWGETQIESVIQKTYGDQPYYAYIGELSLVLPRMKDWRLRWRFKPRGEQFSKR